jgi:spermidine synthase
VTKVHVKEVFLVTKSAYQTINVVDLDVFGRSLILDGVMQSAECDERIYHESLVHPALCAHPNPKSVFIAGGGEGATGFLLQASILVHAFSDSLFFLAREILRFKSVERCVMVDIDDVVIESSKAYLQQHHNGAFDDPRLHLVVGDAEGWIRSTNEKFDVIVMDLPDPQEGGPCWRMYTKEFYSILSSLLNPGI